MSNTKHHPLGWWTRARIIQAMHEWEQFRGRRPTRADWMMATERNPSMIVVDRRFGSWNAAIVAAGYEPDPRGRKKAA